MKRLGIRSSAATWWSTLAGAVGGFLGHQVAGPFLTPFFDFSLRSRMSFPQMILGQAFIALFDCLVLSSILLAVDNHQSLRGRWNRDLQRSLPLFALIGFVSGGVAQIGYGFIGITRAIFWIVQGAGVGASVGIARRDKVQAQRCALGGAIGGCIGGLLVDAFLAFSYTDEAFITASALGIIITGALIGLFMRLVQNALQNARLIGVSPGTYEGKSYPLNSARVSVGRSELNDISLYRASELGMQSGALVQTDGHWEWQGEMAEINAIPQTTATLNSGDTIKLGGTLFRLEQRSVETELPATPVAVASATPLTPSVAPAPQLPGVSNESGWVLSGMNDTIEIPASAQIKVGRSAQNRVVLSDASVSGVHAMLELKEGLLSISDLASTNGTCVNGRRIPANTATTLNNNDRVLLGQQEYVVRHL